MVRKVIRHDKVTREQYDKLQIDVVNKIEELELEIEKLQEEQIRLDKDVKTRTTFTFGLLFFITLGLMTMIFILAWALMQ